VCTQPGWQHATEWEGEDEGEDEGHGQAEERGFGALAGVVEGESKWGVAGDDLG
jgi:hypothetical protein